MTACPYCTVANPAGHASSPSGPWELAVVALGMVLVVFALLAAAKLLFRPGERSPDHVKRTVLDDAAPPPTRQES